MFQLSGKTALVAGGAGYLGVPVVRGLAEQGAAVVVADLREAEAVQAAEGVSQGLTGARVSALRLDVADEASVVRAVETTVQRHGGLDILVNCTYRSIGKRVEDLGAEEFDAANRVNLTGGFLLVREAGRVMKAGGSIILFSSMYGQIAPDPSIYHPPMNPNPIEYGMAKAAVLQMTRYLAAYWGSRGIRVNAVVPGPFPHPRTVQASPDFIERLARKVPLGRIGRAEETAGAVVFLASDDASYVTGQALAVDGGWTAW